VDYARQLNVVGPARVPLSVGTPAEAAARAVGVDARVERVQSEATPPNPWRDRFDSYAGSLDAEEGVIPLIKNAARVADDFPDARAGEIPLQHVRDVAEAAGVDPRTVDRRGLGRLLQNDREVRYAIQLMLEVTEGMRDAAREHVANPTEQSRIKLQAAILRRNMAVEQVVGLRAEWGRTGNVFQEFQALVKDQEALTEWMSKQTAEGRGVPPNPDALDKFAKGVISVPRTNAAKMANKLREPGAFDKFMWYYINNLISGPFTHIKYVFANGLYGAGEIVSTAAGGVSGLVARNVFGREGGVRSEEAIGQLYGYLAGNRDAFRAAVEAFRTGLQTPLPGEDILGIIPKRNKNIYFQQVAPKNKAVREIYGIPMKGASAIHSYFNFLGYRASIEAQAVRKASEERAALQSLGEAGYGPVPKYWDRARDLASNPTEAMMREAIADGYKLTFIKEVGPAMKLLGAGLSASKVGRLILPFMHIPANIASAAIEYHPLFAPLKQDVRDALMGRKGATAAEKAVNQDKAIGRLLIGSAAGASIMMLYNADVITGAGPVDKADRDSWLLTHQPYSVNIGGVWHSYNRFGPIGVILGLHANVADIIPYIKNPSDENLVKAVAMLVHNTGRQLEDEVGMQGMANMLEMIDDPMGKGVRIASTQVASTFLPWSSALRQTASAMDPETREVKTFVDGLKYHIPGLRQTLEPKLDYLGRPMRNPLYGGDAYVPGVSTIIGHKRASTDPIDLEVQRLQIHPAPPRNLVGGIVLPPDLYSELVRTAGAIAREQLGAAISQPGWYDMPAFVRQQTLKDLIRDAHEAATGAMQGALPDLVRQGIENTERQIQGEKPVKKYSPPVAGAR
jgi:hypothetical protein